MPLTMPSGHFFSSRVRLAPPPQPQSSTAALPASFRNRKPQWAMGLWHRFIMDTITRPPNPAGLRVFSKNDMFSLLILG